jgi:uncharacterized protein (DUF1499 family)
LLPVGHGARLILSFLTLAMLLVSWQLAAQGEQVNATDKSFTELAPLSRPDSPNNWLVAPSDFASAKADQAAPVFDQPSDRLARSWIAVIEKQPRTTILRVSEDGLQVEAQQRSAVFGFIDRISAWFIPVAPERSTLIAYSRSLVGYWDLGVNRNRLQRWLTDLKKDVAAGESTR